MSGLDLGDDSRLAGVSVLDDYQPGLDTPAQDLLDTRRHAGRRLAGPDDKNPRHAGEIAAESARVQHVAFQRECPNHCRARLYGGDCLPIDAQQVEGAHRPNIPSIARFHPDRAHAVRKHQPRRMDALEMAPVLALHQNRDVDRFEQRQVVQRIPDPDGGERRQTAAVVFRQHPGRPALVVVAEDVEKPPSRPVQTPGLDGTQKIRCARVVRIVEHERLVELAAPRQVGLHQGQSSEFRHADRGQVAEAGDGYAEFPLQLLQSRSQFRVRRAERDQVTAVGHLPLDREREQTLGNADPAAIFEDERIVIAQTLAVDLDLPTRLARTEHEGNPERAQHPQRREGCGETVGFRVEQRPVEVGEDESRRGRRTFQRYRESGKNASREADMNRLPEGGPTLDNAYDAGCTIPLLRIVLARGLCNP